MCSFPFSLGGSGEVAQSATSLALLSLDYLAGKCQPVPCLFSGLISKLNCTEDGVVFANIHQNPSCFYHQHRMTIKDTKIEEPPPRTMAKSLKTATIRNKNNKSDN